jgi:hypothetical protein
MAPADPVDFRDEVARFAGPDHLLTRELDADPSPT